VCGILGLARGSCPGSEGLGENKGRGGKGGRKVTSAEVLWSLGTETDTRAILGGFL